MPDFYRTRDDDRLRYDETRFDERDSPMFRRSGGPGRFGDDGFRERGWRDDELRERDWRDDDEYYRQEARRSRRDATRDRRDEARRGLPVEETRRLIASNKVEGTAVYGRDGNRLGTIYNFMVDKYSGQVEYAVMRYGGFMGLGQRYYPLPWATLTYDVRAGGYRIGLTHRDMEHAPSFTRDDEPDFNREYGRSVHDYYGIRY